MPQPLSALNSRIVDISNGVISEVIAESSAFSYNGLTGEASINFTSRPYLFVNGQAQPLAGLTYKSSISDVNPIMASFFGKGLRDPVSKIDLGLVSGAGVLLILKATFNLLYNQENPPPADQQLSEAAILQALSQYDMFGNGTEGYPLGKAFGGAGITFPIPPDGYPMAGG